MTFATRAFAARIAELGFSVDLPTDWVVHDLPQEDVDVSDPTTFVRSIYFHDPDGIRLELAAWTRDLGPQDTTHQPRDAKGNLVSQ